MNFIRSIYINFFITFASSVFPMSTSFAQIPFWTKVHSPGGGFTDAISVSPNGHVFADVGGVYRTTDTGVHWMLAANDSASSVRAYCFAFDSSGIIFAGTMNNGVGMFRSTDDGQTWTQINQGLTWKNIDAITTSRNGHIFIGVNYTGIFRSTNEGDNWVPVDSGLGGVAVYGLAVNSRNSLFASTYDRGMFRSTDDGDHWISINQGIADTQMFFVTINSHDDLFAASLKGRLYRSTNDGIGWTEINNGLPIAQPTAIAVGPGDQLYVARYPDGLFRSTDNGNSWKSTDSILIHYPIDALAIDSTGRLYAGTNYGIFTSTNNGDTWIYACDGLPPLDLSTVSINSRDDIFTVAWPEGGVFRSTDKGQNWTPIDSGLPASAARTLTISKHDNLFVTTGEKAYRSTDNGDHWIPVGSMGGTEAVDFQVMSDGELMATISLTLLNVVYRSTDEGLTWEGLFANQNVGSVTINDKEYIFVVSTSEDLFPVTHLSRSTDNGISWKDSSFSSDFPLAHFGIDSSGYIFIGGGYGSIRTTNDGDTWETLNNIYLNQIAVNRIGKIFAGTCYSEPVSSTDHGETWIQIGSGLPAGAAVSDLAFDTSGYLYAATSKGLFRSGLSTTPVRESDHRLPASYILFQNYPNPFNPSTTIHFELPKETHVILKVYNLLGQELQTLVNETRTAGTYNVEFDGSNLSSGVYFYTLQAGRFVQTKKMLVLK